MSRRDESILNLLVECPWWVSVLVSGIAFVALRFILPSIDFQSMAANAFAKGLSGAAPFVALVLLLPAPIAALNSCSKRRRPDRRRMRGRTQEKARKSGTWVQMQFNPFLDLILLQLLDHFLKEPGFRQLAFDLCRILSRLFQSPSEVDPFKSLGDRLRGRP